MKRASQLAFALTMIGLGLLGLMGDHPAIWAGIPRTLPGRVVLLYSSAVIAVLTGAGLLWQRSVTWAARVLAAWFAVWLVCFRLSHAVFAPTSSGAWWGCGETAVLLASAWVLTGDAGLTFARWFYGLGLIPLGVAHFTYWDRTVSMVPGWLPGHVEWAAFTGAAFIACGLGIVFGVYARLGAALSALEMGLFTLLVWGPVLLAGYPSASDWAETVSSWTLTIAAWVVAGSWRGTPWFGRGRRQSEPTPGLA